MLLRVSEWAVTGEVIEVCIWIQKQNLLLVARLALVSVIGESIAPQARKSDCLMFETDLMLKPRNWSITVVCFYFSREKAIIPTGSPKITRLEGGRKKKEKGRLKWRGKLLLCGHSSLARRSRDAAFYQEYVGMQWSVVTAKETAKEEQTHHCYTTPSEMINEICGRQRGVSLALLWRCKHLVVCCFIKFLKYLLNVGLFLVIHYNVISPHFYGDSWSHINSFSLAGSSMGKV